MEGEGRIREEGGGRVKKTYSSSRCLCSWAGFNGGW